MDKVFETKQNGVDVVIIVEDSLITTGKIYVNDSLVKVSEFSTPDNPEGVPYTKENYDKVFDAMQKEVAETISAVATA